MDFEGSSSGRDDEIFDGVHILKDPLIILTVGPGVPNEQLVEPMHKVIPPT